MPTKKNTFSGSRRLLRATKTGNSTSFNDANRQAFSANLLEPVLYFFECLDVSQGGAPAFGIGSAGRANCVDCSIERRNSLLLAHRLITQSSRLSLPGRRAEPSHAQWPFSNARSCAL